MSTQALTTYYCAVCDAVANFFKGAVEGTRFDPKFDSKTYKQLSQMTNRELNDIGISRGDILHISMGGTVYRGEHR